MRWLILALALAIWPVAAAQDAGRGTLTILIRNPAGTPLAGVTIALLHDTDTDGPVVVTTATTNADGRSARRSWRGACTSCSSRGRPSMDGRCSPPISKIWAC